MRYAVIVAILLAIFITPAVAQSTIFEQGVYEFEDTIASMAYSGPWTTVTTGVSYQRADADAAFVALNVQGKTLVIWRQVSTGASSMDICVGGVTCVNVNNTHATHNGLQMYIFTLPSSAPTLIYIVRNTGTLWLDKFMVLSDAAAAGGMPTAVPTATILPSSTPAYTATPGPTPVDTATAVPSSTPAFTATPYELPNAIWALDPAANYGSTNGQITATYYEMAAPDYLSLFLLSAILGVNCVAVGLTIWRRK
jgi:hypothetical protein